MCNTFAKMKCDNTGASTASIRIGNEDKVYLLCLFSFMKA